MGALGRGAERCAARPGPHACTSCGSAGGGIARRIRAGRRACRERRAGARPHRAKMSLCSTPGRTTGGCGGGWPPGHLRARVGRRSARRAGSAAVRPRSAARYSRRARRQDPPSAAGCPPPACLPASHARFVLIAHAAGGMPTSPPASPHPKPAVARHDLYKILPEDDALGSR